MIKRADQLPTEVYLNRFGGNGEVVTTRILEMEQFNGKGRLFARTLIKPGCSIGYHQHKADAETYYILSGEGTVNDNGILTQVKAGDVVFTNSGESHSIENTGSTDLEYIALILFA